MSTLAPKMQLLMSMKPLYSWINDETWKSEAKRRNGVETWNQLNQSPFQFRVYPALSMSDFTEKVERALGW